MKVGYFVTIMIVTFISKCIRSDGLTHLALCNSIDIWIMARDSVSSWTLLQKVPLQRKA